MMIDALRLNNMKGYMVKDGKEAVEIVRQLIKPTDVIGLGGSITLTQAGIMDFLREGGYKVLDWTVEKDPEKKARLYRETFNADVLLTGTNAITEDGKLYNIDGRGNRVAAMIFGPKKVIIVCGRNKIVKNLREAKERLETIAAPLNVKRLGKKTGCAEAGCCVDCHFPERICCTTVIHEQQWEKDRMHVIIIDKELGF
jgi:L-lactate utilization protein LutB